ncbi:hypothetical protein NW762_010940, partial [Fusarium torreyae]
MVKFSLVNILMLVLVSKASVVTVPVADDDNSVDANSSDVSDAEFDADSGERNVVYNDVVMDDEIDVVADVDSSVPSGVTDMNSDDDDNDARCEDRDDVDSEDDVVNVVEVVIDAITDVVDGRDSDDVDIDDDENILEAKLVPGEVRVP